MTRAYEIAAALREFSFWAEYGEDADEQEKMTADLYAAADLIENQQRHIEALMKANDSLKDAIARRDKQIEDMNHMLDKMPTIDAVPVVRCKDCKHRFKDSWCEYVDDDDNFYCARGERKEGADNG